MNKSLFDLLKNGSNSASELQPQSAALAPLPTGNLGAGASSPIDPSQGIMVADMLKDLQSQKLDRLKQSGMKNPSLFDVLPTPAPQATPDLDHDRLSYEASFRKATHQNPRKK